LKDRITDIELATARKEALALLRILRTLRSIKDEGKRARILKAIAVLMEVEG
jgi:hypothetical protein